jgi:hypothetical protein
MPQGHAKKQVIRLANKGSRVAKPKKAKNSIVNKKYTSGLISKTEALLGERAGHMELVGAKKPAAKSASGNVKLDRALKKGGSKKFG